MTQRPVAPLRRGEDNIFAECATTANTVLSGLQTIDDYACQSGDYVLVWKQTAQGQNDVYQVRPGAWYKIGSVGHVIVRKGTTYGASMFMLTAAHTYKQLRDRSLDQISFSVDATTGLVYMNALGTNVGAFVGGRS